MGLGEGEVVEVVLVVDKLVSLVRRSLLTSLGHHALRLLVGMERFTLVLPLL